MTTHMGYRIRAPTGAGSYNDRDGGEIRSTKRNKMQW